MDDAPVQAPAREPGLDAVRGIAILLVVAYHYLMFLPESVPALIRRPITYFAKFGWTGVDLFFVLSGFLIGGILIDKRGSKDYFPTFYGRRFVRILPLYTLSLVAYLALFVLVDWRTNGLSTLFAAGLPLWSFLGFAQNIVMALQGHWAGPGWLGVTWSLAVEEQFYLILPALIFFAPRHRLPTLFCGLVLLAPMARWACLAIAPGNQIAPYILLPCRADSLFVGALAAWAVRDARARDAILKWRKPLVWAFVTASVGLLFDINRIDPLRPAMQTIGYTLMAGYYGLAVLLVATGKPAGRRLQWMRAPLCWAGLGAYSIYLFHRPVQGLIGAGLHQDTLPVLAASLSAMSLLAYFLWHGVERPLIAWGRARLRYRR